MFTFSRNIPLDLVARPSFKKLALSQAQLKILDKTLDLYPIDMSQATYAMMMTNIKRAIEYAKSEKTWPNS